MVESVTFYGGNIFYLSLIEHFGSAAAIIVTTCRKVRLWRALGVCRAPLQSSRRAVRF